MPKWNTDSGEVSIAGQDQCLLSTMNRTPNTSSVEVSQLPDPAPWRILTFPPVILTCCFGTGEEKPPMIASGLIRSPRSNVTNEKKMAVEYTKPENKVLNKNDWHCFMWAKLNQRTIRWIRAKASTKNSNLFILFFKLDLVVFLYIDLTWYIV